MSITLTSPFPPEHVPLLWSWLHQFPQYNFDDSQPRDAQELEAMIWWRQEDGEVIWEVKLDDLPVGAIGYKKLTPEEGLFRGICFTSSVHGLGIAYYAVSQALNIAFRDGTQVVKAEFFAHNYRIQKLLEKLGGTVSDYITCGSIQNGKLIDWKVVEITQLDYLRSYQEYLANPQSILSPEDIPAIGG